MSSFTLFLTTFKNVSLKYWKILKKNFLIVNSQSFSKKTSSDQIKITKDKFSQKLVVVCYHYVTHLS